ncbi:hypothetical protein LZ554_002184 [Drepanopeziza brunnea f. sp. 'monogermtubi']|nr:hypothetical protein LZ554_002184 [Drepanopeziza brunnea f. sp. 'monogermtubi']
MRFIDTETYQLITDDEPKFRDDPSYAILSHRWIGTEITFKTLSPAELVNVSLQTPQLNKIRGACANARKETPPLNWLWNDTCCIDKSNAVEQTRSINSMFEWYSQATVCYAYLHDVAWSAPSAKMFKSQEGKRKEKNLESEWFEQWRLMGTKGELAGFLNQVTGIHEKYLTGEVSIHKASVAARMSWMAGRTTKEVEDIAYSMLGIFGVTITPQYGEGTKAFMRLQRTLIEFSTDESIFAWTIPRSGLECYRGLGLAPEFSPRSWGILAPSPDCFRDSSQVFVEPRKVVPRFGGGYRWTQQGVQFNMSALPGAEMNSWLGNCVCFAGRSRKEITMPLNCWVYGTDGTTLTIVLQLVKTNNGYRRQQCQFLGKKKGAKANNNRSMGVQQITTRPLIITQPEF